MVRIWKRYLVLVCSAASMSACGIKKDASAPSSQETAQTQPSGKGSLDDPRVAQAEKERGLQRAIDVGVPGRGFQIIINGGQQQRSYVFATLSIVFDTPTRVRPEAIKLVRQEDGLQALAYIPYSERALRDHRVHFFGDAVDRVNAIPGGMPSLKEGCWDLVIDLWGLDGFEVSQILRSNSGNRFYTLRCGTNGFNMHRLIGDLDGNGVVNSADLDTLLNGSSLTQQNYAAIMALYSASTGDIVLPWKSYGPYLIRKNSGRTTKINYLIEDDCASSASRCRNPAPALTVNDGSSNRSHVRMISLSFRGTLEALPGAVYLRRESDGLIASAIAIGTQSPEQNMNSRVAFSFEGDGTQIGSEVNGMKSLKEGRWQLIIDGSKLKDLATGQRLAGIQVVPASSSFGEIFRRTGDFNGDGTISQDDLDILQRVLVNADPVPTGFPQVLDVNGDGQANLRDVLFLGHEINSRFHDAVIGNPVINDDAQRSTIQYLSLKFKGSVEGFERRMAAVRRADGLRAELVALDKIYDDQSKTTSIRFKFEGDGLEKLSGPASLQVGIWDLVVGGAELTRDGRTLPESFRGYQVLRGDTENFRFTRTIGDMDGNGLVTDDDASLIEKFLVSLVTKPPNWGQSCEVLFDGRCNGMDALLIKKMVIEGGL